MYTGHRAEPSFRFPQQLAKDTKGKKISAYAKQPALTRFSYASQRTGKASKTQRELAKLWYGRGHGKPQVEGTGEGRVYRRETSPG